MAKKIDSTFLLLDVCKGRNSIARRVAAGHKVPVLIKGYIVSQWGPDDGVSIEFEVDVKKATECDG